MADVNEVSSTLTGAAGLAAAQSIPGSAFTTTTNGTGGSLFPPHPTATLVGNIASGTDEDYYAFTFAAGQVIRLDVDFSSGGLDPILQAFGPGGVTLGGSGIVGWDDASFIDPGSNALTDPLVDLTVTASGSWRFLVRGFGGTTGGYRLNVTILTDPALYVGTAGADQFFGDLTADTIYGFAAGAETVDAGADTLLGNAGNDLIGGGGGADSLLGGADNDTIDGGAGNDTIDGGTGADSLAGGLDADVLLGDAGADTLDGGDGADSLDGGFDSDVLVGGLGDDTMTGGNGPGADTLDGGDGADDLFGSSGPDLMLGGLGNDTLRGSSSGIIDSTAGGENDTLQGGDGNDLLEGGAGNDRLLGGAGDDTIYGGYQSTGTPAPGNDTIVSGAGNDLIFGSDTATDATLNGNDLVQGGAGADTIIGRGGADRLFGNDGNDLVYGADTNSAGGDGVRDVIDGGAGADTLNGAWGDRLLGGDGNDVVNLDLLGNVPLVMPAVDGGAGTDALLVSGLPFAVQRVVFDASVAGRATVALTYNDGTGAQLLSAAWIGFESYRMVGSDGSQDVLTGGTGADTLYAAGGSGDQLFGGAGSDLLVNGIGARSASDVNLFGGSGGDTLDFAGRPSGVASGLGSGGDGSDLLVVHRTDNYLPGQIYLTGDAGDDIVAVDAGDIVADGGTGNDLLRVTAGDNAPMLVEVDAGDGIVTAGGLSVVYVGFERYAFTGGGGSDTLVAEGGADTLDGGAGADLMVAGLGNDVFVVDNLGDVLVDAGGVDAVRASLSWTLLPGFETLVLIGDAAINGTGNASVNRMAGNDAANILSGEGGADSILGAGGADTLLGGEGADTLVGGAGADRLTGGAANDIFVLALNEAEGDVVTDFAGAGVPGGDVLRIVGFGAGTTLTYQAGTLTWLIQGTNGSSVVTITGVTALGADDVVLA